jgi:hypothetical protein
MFFDDFDIHITKPLEAPKKASIWCFSNKRNTLKRTLKST